MNIPLPVTYAWKKYASYSLQVRLKIYDLWVHSILKISAVQPRIPRLVWRPVCIFTLSWQMQQVKVRLCLESLLCRAMRTCGLPSQFGGVHLLTGCRSKVDRAACFCFPCLSSFQVIKACNAKASLLQGSHREGWGCPQLRRRTPVLPSITRGFLTASTPPCRPLSSLHTEVNFLLWFM